MAEQKPILVNDEDRAALVGAFKNNEDLLLAVRSLWYGFPVSEHQKTVIKTTFRDDKLKAAVRRKLFPVLELNVPIGQEADFWGGSDQQILGRSPEEIAQVVGYKWQAFQMFEMAMKLLDDPTGPCPDLSYDPRKVNDPFQIGLLARNTFIRTVTNTLIAIKAVVDIGIETPTEAKLRKTRDSNK